MVLPPPAWMQPAGPESEEHANWVAHVHRQPPAQIPDSPQGWTPVEQVNQEDHRIEETEDEEAQDPQNQQGQ